LDIPNLHGAISGSGGHGKVGLRVPLGQSDRLLMTEKLCMVIHILHILHQTILWDDPYLKGAVTGSGGKDIVKERRKTEVINGSCMAGNQGIVEAELLESA
jgi:hypothetical protein